MICFNRQNGKRILGLSILLLLPALAGAEEESSTLTDDTITIRLGIYDEHVAGVRQALVSKPCEEITDYYQNDNQVAMEAVLFCQALKLGGLKAEFQFVGYPSQARLLRELERGRVTAGAFAFWGSDYDEQLVYKSQNLINSGEFEKGFYALPTNTELLSINNKVDLGKFLGVSNKDWSVDWDALECIGADIESSFAFPMMFRMVQAGRVDYMITSFSVKEDLSQDHFGVRLIPVPGMKLVLADSLNYFVSRKYPQSQLIAQALDSGLTQLREEGTIRKAYEAVGFFSDAVKDWDKLGCNIE